MRLRHFTYFLLLLAITGACHKKDAQPPPDPDPVPVVPPPVNTDTSFVCRELPPAPKPFGWQDSTVDVDKNITAFIYDPVNNDQIIYVAQGNVASYNLIRNKNLVSGNIKELGNCGAFMPSVNSKGWVLYNTADNNLVIVKSNGDSLRVLISDNRCIAPHWDFEGKNFYYFFPAVLNVSSRINRARGDGSALGSFDADLPYMASYNKSDKVLYMKTASTQVTLIERDVPNGTERELISGSYNEKTSTVEFNHLCVDRNDQFFYWTNPAGLFRCNITTLKVDTLRRNCQNYIIDRPMMSFRQNEMTFAKHELIPVSPFILYHRYRPAEMDLLTGKTTFKDFFPLQEP